NKGLCSSRDWRSLSASIRRSATHFHWRTHHPRRAWALGHVRSEAGTVRPQSCETSQRAFAAGIPATFRGAEDPVRFGTEPPLLRSSDTRRDLSLLSLQKIGYGL